MNKLGMKGAVWILSLSSVWPYGNLCRRSVPHPVIWWSYFSGGLVFHILLFPFKMYSVSILQVVTSIWSISFFFGSSLISVSSQLPVTERVCESRKPFKMAKINQEILLILLAPYYLYILYYCNSHGSLFVNVCFTILLRYICLINAPDTCLYHKESVYFSVG